MTVLPRCLALCSFWANWMAAVKPFFFSVTLGWMVGSQLGVL